MDDITRFWLKIKRGDPYECWLWQAGKEHGYGSFRMGGRSLRAHRLAWELANGPIPTGKHVLHHCDNPPCCNPAHLYVGTNVENGRDRKERGRAVNNFPAAVAKRKPGWNRKKRDDDRRGGNRPPALAENAVVAIRERYAVGGVGYRDLAEEYGVTAPTIMAVVRRLGAYRNA